MSTPPEPPAPLAGPFPALSAPSDTLSSPTEPLEEDARVESDDAAPVQGAQDAEGRKPFGGMTPSEAAKQRWALQRERAAVESEAVRASADDTRLVHVPIGVGLVIKRLDEDARKGSTQAARELRAWLEQYPPTDESFDPSTLERAQRTRMYARLLDEDEALSLQTD